MKTNIQSRYFVVVSAAIVSFSACNITPALISVEAKASLSRQVETRPYIGLFEGFQPLSQARMNDLAKILSHSNKLSACATSGNPNAHMPIIRIASKHHQPIYIIGFSMGEAEALNLAEECEKEKIPVEKLFLLDGVKKAKIHTSVKHVVDIVGTSPYMFRRSERYQKVDLENKKTDIKYREINCDHLSLPENSRAMLLAEIK